MRISPIILLFSLFTTPSLGYVSSGLPAHTHQKWLEQLTVDICKTQPGDMTPEMIHSTPQVMSAWAQNPYTHNSNNNKFKNESHGVECALAVEKLLKRIVDERLAGNKAAVPTTSLYNAALRGWAMAASEKEKGSAAQRAEQILMHMQTLYEAGDSRVQPNTDSFYSVMLAWSWSREKYAAQRARQVLDWMTRLSETESNNEVGPSIKCFSLVLSLIAKSGSKTAGREAEEVFKDMESFHAHETTTQHFNLVLDAWRRSGTPDAAKRTEEILNYMEKLSAAGVANIKPNLITYTTVIQTLSRSRQRSCPKRATQMLKRLENDYKDGDESMAPDSIIYNIVLDKWAKSGEHDAAIQAKKILGRMSRLSEEMKSKKCSPDVYSYTSVMSACAQTVGSKKDRIRAYQIARGAFDELCRRKDEGLSPNHVTYGTMLKACGNLLPRREEYIMNEAKEIFLSCARDGQVGDMVVSRLRQAACADLYHELLEGNQKNNLPAEWCRNVREKRPNLSTKIKSNQTNKNALAP